MQASIYLYLIRGGDFETDLWKKKHVYLKQTDNILTN